MFKFLKYSWFRNLEVWCSTHHRRSLPVLSRNIWACSTSGVRPSWSAYISSVWFIALRLQTHKPENSRRETGEPVHYPPGWGLRCRLSTPASEISLNFLNFCSWYIPESCAHPQEKQIRCCCGVSLCKPGQSSVIWAEWRDFLQVCPHSSGPESTSEEGKAQCDKNKAVVTSEQCSILSVAVHPALLGLYAIFGWFAFLSPVYFCLHDYWISACRENSPEMCYSISTNSAFLCIICSSVL